MHYLDRRQFTFGVAGSLGLVSSTGSLLAKTPAAKAPVAKLTAKQYHNQPSSSPLHKALVDLWTAVRTDTDGALDVTVFPQNNNIPGSDPAALKQLQSGELEFYTLMGGILSQAVPVMDVQGLPWVYTSSQQIHKLDDGPLGRYLDAECRAKGIERLRGGLFENGFRQTNTVDREIRTVADFADLKIRVPDGEMFRDFFTTLGAKPVTLNINKLYEALKTKDVDGQENPLVIAQTNKLYEVTHHMAMTNHMWSGFNLLANKAFYDKLPDNVKKSIAHRLPPVVEAERKTTDDLNRSLEKTLQDEGMSFTRPDPKELKAKLDPAFYTRWKQRLGDKTWTLLEAGVGKIG